MTNRPSRYLRREILTDNFPGTLFLFDTSALARRRHPAVRETILQAIEDGVAATCITVELEMGYSARHADELDALLQNRRDALTRLPITEHIAERAQQVQLLMARKGLHRAAGVVDLLTAAIAEYAHAVVVHYDADFDHIASVTGQQTSWILPPGEVD